MNPNNGLNHIIERAIATAHQAHLDELAEAIEFTVEKEYESTITSIRNEMIELCEGDRMRIQMLDHLEAEWSFARRRMIELAIEAGSESIFRAVTNTQNVLAGYQEHIANGIPPAAFGDLDWLNDVPLPQSDESESSASSNNPDLCP